MSRTARTAIVAVVVFALAGTGSGLLIDEQGGALGALEWVLRTLVVISAAVALATGFVLVLRLRHRVRPRPLAWVITVLAAAAFAFFVVQPAGYAVYLTHLPTRRTVHDADLGAAKQPVLLRTASGLRLRGWYVPSRNGAAVAVMHGTGSNRLGVADHARLLARHGYGVLIFDFHGHGTSDGRSTSSLRASSRTPTQRGPTCVSAPTSAPAESGLSASRSAARSPSTPPRAIPSGGRSCWRGCKALRPPT